MKIRFLPSVTLLFLLFQAADTSAQLFGPSPKNAGDVFKEFARANGGQLPASTTDPAQTTIYITMDNARGQVFATSNYTLGAPDTLGIILQLQQGMLDAGELNRLFGQASNKHDVTGLPIWIHNDVFRVFLDTRFLDRYKNISLVSGEGKRWPVRSRMAELQPGLFVSPGIEMDKLASFLFERSFDPAGTEALSLLNNKEVNTALNAVYADFQAIRTVDQIEKAFEKSQKKTICLVGHISADGQVLRYRSNGEISYELPLTQFLHMADDLQKEVILIGCNFADDTSRTLDPAAEVKLMESAFQKRHWGEVLQSLAGQGNQVQITEPNTDGFYFKRAEVTRPDGVKPARAYTFVFFKTPAKPSVFISSLRWMFDHSGIILLSLAGIQLLFFFAIKGRWVNTLKWINWALLFIFLFAFLFSFR